MKIETLVSCVEQNETELIEKMGLEQDAVIIHQTDVLNEGELSTTGGKARIFRTTERGVGRSRNMAIDHADEAGDICLFSDEDIRYVKGYTDLIVKEYEAHPEADMILFNMKVTESRRTYWNEAWKRIHFYNYGRYPAYSISIKTPVLLKRGIRFSPWFGGGARYSNGEDSLFLKDCLKAGLKIYASPICLGEEEERNSTWFSGYHEKFFHDRGVLYAFLYGPMKYVMIWVFLLRKRKTICREVPLLKAASYMAEGVREAKTLG